MLDQATGVKSLEAANPYRTIQPLGYLRVPEARGTENFTIEKEWKGGVYGRLVTTPGYVLRL